MSSYQEGSPDEAPSTICPVCLEAWNASDRLPKFLVCHHSICVTCAGGLQRTAKKKLPRASAEPSASGLQQLGASRESLGSLDTSTDDVVQETASWVRCPMCRTRTFIEDPYLLQTNFYLSGLSSSVPAPRLVLWCETCSKVAAPECGDHNIEPIDEKMRYLQEELVRRTDVLQGYVKDSLSAHETHMEVYRWLCGMLRHSHSKVLAALTHAAQYHQALQHHTEALQNLVQRGENLLSINENVKNIRKMTSLLKELDIQQSSIIREVELPILNDTFQILRTHQGPTGYSKALVVLDADKSVTLSLYGERDRQQVNDSEDGEAYESDESSSALKRALSLQMSRRKKDFEHSSSWSLQKSTLVKETVSNYQKSLVTKGDDGELQTSMMLQEGIPDFQTSNQLEDDFANIEHSDMFNESNQDIQKDDDLLNTTLTSTHNTEKITKATIDNQHMWSDTHSYSLSKESIADLRTTDLLTRNIADAQSIVLLKEHSNDSPTTDLSAEATSTVRNTDLLQGVTGDNEKIGLLHIASDFTADVADTDVLHDGTNDVESIDLLHDSTPDFTDDVTHICLLPEGANDSQNLEVLPAVTSDLTQQEAEEEIPVKDDVLDSFYSARRDVIDGAPDTYPSAPPQNVGTAPEEVTYEAIEPIVVHENHSLLSFPTAPLLESLPRDGTFGRQTVSIANRRYPSHLYDEEPIIEPASLLNNTGSRRGDDSTDVDEISLHKESPIEIATTPLVALTHPGDYDARPDAIMLPRNQEERSDVSSQLRNTEGEGPISEEAVASRNRRRRGKRGKKRPSSTRPRRPNPGESQQQQQHQEQQRPRGRQRSRGRRHQQRRRSSSMCRVH
ncbi:uncharacterized protein LOC135219837 [Macrobrachium nipponense]|uniref:uncharacterized protein LOC135219837 n=1 Tax=Macrobrachium nipponense TaxID=159736 RepID=UPI0030C8C34B